MMGSAAHKDVGDGSDVLAGGGQEWRHGELNWRERDRPAEADDGAERAQRAEWRRRRRLCWLGTAHFSVK